MVTYYLDTIIREALIEKTEKEIEHHDASCYLENFKESGRRSADTSHKLDLFAYAATLVSYFPTIAAIQQGDQDVERVSLALLFAIGAYAVHKISRLYKREVRTIDEAVVNCAIDIKGLERGLAVLNSRLEVASTSLDVIDAFGPQGVYSQKTRARVDMN